MKFGVFVFAVHHCNLLLLYGWLYHTSNGSLFEESVTCLAIFFARDSMATVFYLSPVCPSVHLSVTRVDQSKTVEVRLMQLSPQSSPIPLRFCDIRLIQKF